MKTVKDIRNEFLGYFEDHGHEIVPSSPLVPQNDPTLMFVNAGMVQFKNVFTGVENRPYTRATSSQKCVRAGGKHNDLENVGYTARHLTFFEMLGNFSFGDYFKEDAIAMAWELVTKNFELPAEKLLVTVHSSDEEAASIWKKVTGFSDDKIIRIPTSDNFWSMGDTGPCGPCTEIFYDHGEEIPGGPPGSPDEDGDRFIEIWNNVFMQFEQLEDGSRIDLPKPSIDTGMGLERISSILQGVHSVYETDLFQSIIKTIEDSVSVKENASHRVIADHLRSSAFLMADGVLPSNEGRGYVLRRIMRRGMRHAHLLGASEPLMHKLFPTLQSLMGEAYPELNRAGSLITETLKTEEEKFKTTLERGLKILDEETEKLGSGKKFPGDVAFKLYDTFGFPLDLTQDALKSRNIEVDLDTFKENMEAQKAAARQAWSGSGDAATEKVWFEILDNNAATEFLGYETDKAEAQVLAWIRDGEIVDKVEKGQQVMCVTNQTPFYAESGGQVGDHGKISKQGAVMSVTDTKKQLGKLFVHIGKIDNGSFEKGDVIEMTADGRRRNAIRANHSATHLLHAALREYLGDHISQKGSLVAKDRLRFDISHPKQVSRDEMTKVEERVNAEIRANTDVVTRLMDRDAAIKAGAMALFGEKYDDEVRVLTMGRENPETKIPFSVELCGGTHVKRTGDIGLFKIISEGAVSSGVRRIEAVTGEGALAYFTEQEERLGEAAQLLKTTPSDVTGRIEALIEERKKLENEVSALRKKIATGGTGGSEGNSTKKIGDITFAPRVLEDFPAKDLKPMADDLKKQIGSGVVALVATNEGKASLVVAVTDDLTGNINAVDLVRIGAEALGGKGGGGRPDMAQAGGPEGAAANDAIAAIEGKLAQ
ncbi:MAG: alanine--tRNA ligase [Micavibrio sp.]|nr:alanine--tRNA ligase [Micavibrio sp.]